MRIEQLDRSLFLGRPKKETVRILPEGTKTLLGYKGWSDKEVTLEVLKHGKIKLSERSRVPADDNRHTQPLIEYRILEGEEINRVKIKGERKRLFQRKPIIKAVEDHKNIPTSSSSALPTIRRPRSYR